MDSLKNWTFPYKTCEIPQKNTIVSQPYSFLLNLINVSNLVCYCILVKSIHVKLTILSYIVFELFHTFSHAKLFHVKIQTTVIHLLAYVFFAATWNSIYLFTKKPLSWLKTSVLIVVTAIDIYVVLVVKGVWTILSGLSLLLALFCMYFTDIPKFFQTRLYQKLVPGLFVLFALFVNEAINCEAMLRIMPFPYHIVIEILGYWLFDILANSWYIWDMISYTSS